jgi:hypothetical protein
MTTPRDPDEILAMWLDEGPTRLPDQTRRAISVALPTTSQRRRGWSVPWRPNIMSTTLKYAIGAVAVFAIAFGGWYLLVPASGGVGAGPSPTPSPTASPAGTSPSGTSSASAYDSAAFGVPLSLTLPDGWSIDSQGSDLIGLSGPDQPATIMNMSTMTVRGATATDPWTPWPADIEAWLGARPEFRPGASHPVTVGGADTGDWVRSAPGDGINLRGANAGGWKIHLVVVPTGTGTGIVGYTDGPPAGFQQAADSLDQLLATLRFR